MLDFGFYNMDCMKGMKEFPDKYFDLAVVDPPYGDGGGVWKRPDRSRFGGVFDKYRKQALEPIRREVRQIQKDLSPGRAAHGRGNLQKNYYVGRCAGEGLFCRTFPRLT